MVPHTMQTTRSSGSGVRFMGFCVFVVVQQYFLSLKDLKISKYGIIICCVPYADSPLVATRSLTATVTLFFLVIECLIQYIENVLVHTGPSFCLWEFLHELMK